MSASSKTSQVKQRPKCKQRPSGQSNKSQVNGVSKNGPIKTDNQPTTAGNANQTVHKATYSAQYESPQISQQQKLNTNSSPSNIPNVPSTNYPCCNGIPLYNTPAAMLYQKQDNLRQNNTVNNMQRPCPCNRLSPPMPPCEDALWDLQFCRWWGWNWIRKREEMLNKKKAEESKRSSSGSRIEDQRPNKPRKRWKQDDFFSWCNKIFKGRNKKVLKDVEKEQLQELYDTPCSSITINKCPCPMDDWECRSMDLKGEYECYCDTTRQMSTSTVLINKTRHQRCKQNLRKHQSWVYEKTESSSSDEICPHICVCSPRSKPCTEESVQYLSMRMAQIKSDDEDNQECCNCCTCCNKQKEIKRDACCQSEIKKKKEPKMCHPCMIKVVYKQPNCNNKQTNNCPKQKSPCNIVKPKEVDCPCNKIPILVPRPKVPQNCRCRVAATECKQRPKRKYVEYNCQKNKPNLVDCSCTQPRKRIKMTGQPDEVDYYYCCCNCNKKDENPNVPKCKSEKIIKQTADKCTSSKSMVSNAVNNDQYVYTSFPIGDGMQNKQYNAGQFPVSKAIQEGLYKSPATGRVYTLNPKTFTINHVSTKYNLPEPLDAKENICNIDPIESSVDDEEHNDLLSAVCEAIISSRLSKNARRGKTYPTPKTGRSEKTTFKRPISGNQAFPGRYGDYFNFISNLGQNSSPDTEELSNKNVTGSYPVMSKRRKCFEYKNVMSPNNLQLPPAVTKNFNYVKSFSSGNSGSNMSEINKYYIGNGKHGPIIRRKCPTNLPETDLNMNDHVGRNMPLNTGFFPANIYENYSPRIQESSTNNSTGGSGDSFDSDETFLSTNKNLIEDNTDLYIPFNSPRSWIKPPKIPGISMTGLFSTVGDINSTKRKHKISKRLRYNKTDSFNSFNNQQLYNSLFGNEHPDCCQDLSNFPYDCSPIPNPDSIARNPTLYPSLVLQELHPEVAKGTQTNITITSAVSHNNRTQEVGKACSRGGSGCSNKDDCPGLANLRKSPQTLSKVDIDITLTNSKAQQTNNSKTTETLYISTSKAPRINISKTTTNCTKLIQTPTRRYCRANNTVCSAGNLTNDKNDTKCVKINQTTFSDKPHQLKTNNATSSPFNLANNSKSVVVNTAALSNLPQDSANPTGIINIGQYNKSPPATRSVQVDTSSLNAKSVETNTEKLSKTTSCQVAHDTSNNLFTNENSSEKEIGCRYFNENLYSTYSKSPFSNLNQSYLGPIIDKGDSESCVYIHHESPYKEIETVQSEKILALVNGIPNSPINVFEPTPTTSKGADQLSSAFDPFPKGFKPATPTPVYMATSTSPFKIKYAKTRLDDRSNQESFVKEKVLIRESPFTMFCTPVPSTSFASKTLIDDRGSFSRPDRQMVVNNTKKLKMREKRWRY